MLSTSNFLKVLKGNNINFFSGVPDSLLKDICANISDTFNSKSHVIAANEGSAIGLASGYHLATGEVPLVYMQNSGLGNTVNPLTSLTAPEVYGIPMLLLVGWRGEPGVKDEPQHVKKGAITLGLLEQMNIPYKILSSDTDNLDDLVKDAKSTAVKNNTPFALVVRKGTFEKYQLQNKKSDISNLVKEDVIEFITKAFDNNTAFLGNTGKIARELYEVRKRNHQSGETDFLNVGSMGHTSQIALGVALQTDKNVVCLDGDGSLIMHMGGLTTIGDLAGDNYYHIVLNNCAHDSVGGQPTIADKIDFCNIAKSCGYKSVFKVTNLEELKSIKVDSLEGPSFIEILVKKGSREDLGRPKESPMENKQSFMDFLKQ